NELLIHRRPEDGLLAGLWEFPGFEVSANQSKQNQLLNSLQETYNIEAEIDRKLGNIQHVFTHLKWNLTVFEGIAVGTIKNREDLKFVSMEELQEYPFPVSHQKILQML